MPQRRSGSSGDFGAELAEEASVVGPHELLDEPSAMIEPEYVHEVPDDPFSVRLESPTGEWVNGRVKVPSIQVWQADNLGGRQ